MSVTIDDCRRKEADTLVASRFKRYLLREGPSKKRLKSDFDDGSPYPSGSETLGSNSDDSSDEANKTFNYSEIIRCQICGDKASGMHYGVYSCEGCKGFFRRTQRMKLEYKPCPLWETKPCDITIKSRNKCQYCRFQKCLQLGMSTGAVRMGRVPRAEKEKLLHEMEHVRENLILSETEEEREHRLFVERVYENYARHFEGEKSDKEIEGFRMYVNQEMEVTFPTGIVFKITPLSISPENLAGKPRELTNPFHVSRHLSCASEIGIHKMASCLKNVPEFRSLSAKDQLILFRESCFEIALTFNAERYHLGIIQFPEDNTFVQEQRMEEICTRMDIQSPSFTYITRFNALKLIGREKALFTLLILVAPDREELTDTEAVERFQHKLVKALAVELARNHPHKRNILARCLNLLTLLRNVMPEQINKMKSIISMFDGQLPVQPSPLMKEVYRLT
ncbi:peroxisome proliferator-activated receptor gamma-like [Acanthaster planci]|uniref:Peroxisome proliferator-activated receptor gamma-like n=1 Tax=Acanthaster planci TaxID=133434 RepID=A0A8B8A5N5_ACAPL|nr:peroxisome proliferator-activated receptor gamma-like [Acanthaster planci]XP_022112224.1 peroxisome proliferator-activated receptor gamma-like [Acanthaster planci]XP_022112225.1 peroxisome proliferator-activated receptor gamma-like [Acanthaster planci]